jgi:hypothetical protein
VALLSRPLVRTGVLAVVLVSALPDPPAAAAGQGGFAEHEVKAAFLYNFTKFVQWPADAFATPASPIVLCIVGDDPFGPFLDRLVRGETVSGRRLVVDRVRPAAELAGCHLLFVAASERARFAALLAPLRGGSVLTVGDDAGFLSAGGLFRFVLDGGKVRFEVNLPELGRSRLQVSSKLLQLARPGQDDRSGSGRQGR